MTKRILLAGVAAAALSAIVYQAPGVGQSRPAAPAVRIQASDGGTLGLAHTIRVEGAASPSLDGGVASIYVAAGAGGVLDVRATAPVASSGGLTPTISLTPCPAGQIYKSDGGGVGCAADERGVTSVTATGPIYSSGGTTPNISCSWASASNGGCISLLDWGIFNGKENPLTFSGGLSRAADTVTCDDASPSAEGCVTPNAAQSFSGVKTFEDGIISSNVSAEADEPVNIAPANGVVGLLSTDKLYCPAPAARTFLFDLATATSGRAILRLTNSGNLEANYAADFDIEKGDLYTCSTKRIDCAGNATFASLASASWGAHGHTDAGGGGTLSAAAIASGTLPAARGGTGLSAPTSDSVMVGNGSAWEAKVLADCDATGARVQFDTTGNAFSCATLGAWSTVAAGSFTNGWASSTTPARYRKDADGRVSLSGRIISGTLDATAFTLPAGYQPAAGRGFAVATGVGVPATCMVNVTSGGAVQPRTGCDSANTVYLDGISFYTD